MKSSRIDREIGDWLNKFLKIGVVVILNVDEDGNEKHKEKSHKRINNWQSKK